jgi:ABC-2 type transport system permease protein
MSETPIPFNTLTHAKFSWARLWGMIVKEFIQMRRDRLTLGMMIGIPLMQLFLFTFSINSDPKHLPTAVINNDGGPMSRALLKAMENSEYFEFTATPKDEEAARKLLARGHVQFVVNIPPEFSRELMRGQSPQILLEGDAADPAGVGTALGNMPGIIEGAFANEHLPARPVAQPSLITLNAHRLYNPEIIQKYNTIPGLVGVILTMTMIMITGLAITRERERGTMENLLATPATPFEVLVGKITPYIIVGYTQISLLLFVGHFLFGMPIVGSVPLLMFAALFFIAANLSLGITFSTIAKTQIQAVQMTFFVFLPSILLSGFMFPFYGMPKWAQMIGEILPLTHFLRISRGIILKGNGIVEIFPEIAAIAVFVAIMLTIAIKRYQRTLD